MKRKLLILIGGALILGLAIFALVGATSPDEEKDLPQLTQEPLPPLQAFLQAVADKLGLSVDKLKQVVTEAKDELIERGLERAVKAGRLAQEQAQRLREQLREADPRSILEFLWDERPFAQAWRGWSVEPKMKLREWVYGPDRSRQLFAPRSYCNCCCCCCCGGSYTQPMMRPMVPYPQKEPMPRYLPLPPQEKEGESGP